MLCQNGNIISLSAFFFFPLQVLMKTNISILTITGSDSTGGSGVQADIKTISALGGYALSAITAITVQNTLGIQEFFNLPDNIVAGQIEAIINDIQPEVVKIGMIRSVGTLNAVVGALSKYKPRQTIYDPIVYSSRGDVLMADDVIAQVKCQLLPLIDLVIVRERDAAYFMRGKGSDTVGRDQIAAWFGAFGCRNVIMQEDLLPQYAHGLGNSLASAIAVYLGQGLPMDEALSRSKTFMNQQIRVASDLTGRSSELYNEFVSEVMAHHRTNSDVHFYADCLNVSSRYLAQVTKRISGKSPKSIIDDYLISEIEQQLKTTDKTVQETAYAFGFSSQAHFTKFFKKMKGISPSQYRKK